MTTDVEICAAALSLLGDQTLTTLSSGSPSDRETLCRNLYPLARDFVLRLHPWNCATRRAFLTDPQPNPYDAFVSTATDRIIGSGSNITKGATGGSIRGTTRASTGTLYFEVVVMEHNATASEMGVCRGEASMAAAPSADGTAGWGFIASGDKRVNNGSPTSYSTAWLRGDVIGCVWNATAGSLTFYRNGVSLGAAFASGVAGNLFPAVFADKALRMVLAEDEWLYAPAGVSAWPEDTLTSEYDYASRLWLPTDCLRVLAVGDKDSEPDYVLEGRAILIDEWPLQLTYVADVSESAFDVALTEALTAYMAAQLAYPVTKSAALAEAMTRGFDRKMAQARNTDGQEQPMLFAQASRLMSSRFAGHRLR